MIRSGDRCLRTRSSGRDRGSTREHSGVLGRRLTQVAIAGLAVTALMVGCAPPETAGPGATAELPAPSVDPDFDLDALVEAAKAEGEVTVYDSSGDIVDAAAGFQERYGIKATGVKNKVSDTTEKMTRENQADNVTIDAVLFEDAATITADLLPNKVVYTWIPADIKDNIPEDQQNPLNMLDKAQVFVYNTKLSPDGCPIDTVWDLTKPEWKGKLATQDPLGKPVYLQWFNQLDDHGAQALAGAYQEEFGKEVPGGESEAAKEWIKAIAANQPILTSSDGDAEEAVVTPQQTDIRMGLFSNAKFRDIDDKGYPMRVCSRLNPWPGFAYPKMAAIATKTSHPNAAKLFLHYMLTQEGIDFEISDGGVSPNSENTPGPNPDGLESFDELFHFDSSTFAEDFTESQEMADFWRSNHA